MLEAFPVCRRVRFRPAPLAQQDLWRKIAFHRGLATRRLAKSLAQSEASASLYKEAHSGTSSANVKSRMFSGISLGLTTISALAYLQCVLFSVYCNFRNRGDFARFCKVGNS